MDNLLDEFYDYLETKGHQAFEVLGLLHDYTESNCECEEGGSLYQAITLFFDFRNYKEECSNYAYTKEDKIDMVYDYLVNLADTSMVDTLEDKEKWTERITLQQHYYYEETSQYFYYDEKIGEVLECTVVDELIEFFEDNIDTARDEIQVFLDLKD